MTFWGGCCKRFLRSRMGRSGCWSTCWPRRCRPRSPAPGGGGPRAGRGKAGLAERLQAADAQDPRGRAGDRRAAGAGVRAVPSVDVRRWQRSERALLVACAEMYFQGVSTRNVREVLEAMCDGEISSMTVSRRGAGAGREAVGVPAPAAGCDGVPVPAHRRAVREGAGGRACGEPGGAGGGGVHQRGPAGGAGLARGRQRERRRPGARCFGAEGSRAAGPAAGDERRAPGIVAAMRRHFQGVAWQRCRVHFKRELGRKVSYKVLRELMEDLVVVFAPGERTECLLRGEEMAARVGGPVSGGGEDAAGGSGGLPGGAGLPGASSAAAAIDEHAGEPDEAAEEAYRVWWGCSPAESSCDRLLGAQLIEVHETGRWKSGRTSTWRT